MTKRNPSYPIDRGTPETRKRLKEGTVARLLRTGKIGIEEQSAANEIEYVYSRLTAEAGGKISNYGEFTSPGEKPDWPFRMRQAYQERYLPWMRDMGKIQSLRENGPVADVVRAICCFHASARDMDRRKKWKSGTAQKILVFGLTEYCYLAGWLRRPARFPQDAKKSA